MNSSFFLPTLAERWWWRVGLLICFLLFLAAALDLLLGFLSLLEIDFAARVDLFPAQATHLNIKEDILEGCQEAKKSLGEISESRHS